MYTESILKERAEGFDMTMVSQIMTIPSGYNQTNKGKRISLKGKMFSIRKITRYISACTESVQDTELRAKQNQTRSDTCNDSMNDNDR
jgi:hypothetical protein